jgi:glycosyltransferase involved in cell wall biosynthesis
VVVDDGSGDDPAEVVQRYPGVRFIRQGNQGPAAARNTGFHESSGSYLTFLDADDRLLPNGLEIGMHYIRNSPYAFVSGHCGYISEDGLPISTPAQPIVENGHYLALLQRNYVWAGSTVLHRRSYLEAVNGYNPSPKAKGAEDFELYLRIARDFPVFCHCYITSEYRQYRRYGINVSGNPGLMLGSTLFALSMQRKHVKGNAQEEQAYKQGRKNRKRLWGDLLLSQIRMQLTTPHERTRAIRGLLTLIRYDAPGLLRRLVNYYD